MNFRIFLQLVRIQRVLVRHGLDELIAEDEFAARVYASFSAFAETVGEWTRISEQALLETRAL